MQIHADPDPQPWTEKIRQDIMTTLKGKRFSILFYGKQVKQVEDLNVTVSIKRIAVSVTSPDLDDSNF